MSRHLPEQAHLIANQQGWNEDSVIKHLVSLIMDNISQPEKVMESYFAAMADEENGIDPEVG